jgi:DNA polymerase-3 subunit epsilon
MVGFDTETTGVDSGRDRIVTAAVITRAGAEGSSERRTWLVDPGVEIPAAATAVHGVTTERARAEGVSPDEALPEIASLLAEALTSGIPVVGFNVAYDLGILEAELARHDLPTLGERLGGPSAEVIRPLVDPLVLDRFLDRFRRGKRTLSDLCAVYGVTPDADLHAADADVDATLDLVLAIARRFPALGEVDPSDLHDQQASAHAEWADRFSAFLVSRGRTDDLPVREWPLPTAWPPATDAIPGATS